MDEEPILGRDLVMMGQLRSLGTEKGPAFETDAASTSVLRQPATLAHEGFNSTRIEADTGTDCQLATFIGQVVLTKG